MWNLRRKIQKLLIFLSDASGHLIFFAILFYYMMENVMPHVYRILTKLE